MEKTDTVLEKSGTALEKSDTAPKKTVMSVLEHVPKLTRARSKTDTHFIKEFFVFSQTCSKTDTKLADLVKNDMIFFWYRDIWILLGF